MCPKSIEQTTQLKMGRRSKYTFLLKKFFLLVGVQLLYNVVLVSAMLQHESLVGIHMSPPSRTSFLHPSYPHPVLLSRCHRALGQGPCVLQQIPTGHLFLHVAACMFQCQSLNFPTLSCPCCVHKCVLYVCISTAAPQIGSQSHFSRFHKYMC